MNAEKPDVEKIVDWLILCARDEVTRWEGTYELERSFAALDHKLAREAEEKEKAAQGTPAVGSRIIRYWGYGGNASIEYAQAMNEYHRQALTGLFLTGAFTGQPLKKGTHTSPGDRELVSLVARWGGPQIAQVLGERLKSGTYTAWDNYGFMLSIASILKDKKLEELASKYSRSNYQPDNDPVNADEAPDESDDAAANSPEPVTAEPTAGDVVDANGKPPDTAQAPKAVKPVRTYRDFRADLIGQFLARADAVMFAPADTAENNL
ncbi:MAG: hypothetical protein AB7J13_14820 [Pyrinomonadaceae bacterium]